MAENSVTKKVLTLEILGSVFKTVKDYTDKVVGGASFVKPADMEKAISEAKSEIIGGAPETYDTLKEISDYISSHASVETALNAAIGNKMDKTAIEAITTEEVTAAATAVFGA